jgi:hypothetical protein
MTALLVVVTFAALGLAGGLLFYVLRLTREERDRSEARAAALAELLAPEADDVPAALASSSPAAPLPVLPQRSAPAIPRIVDDVAAPSVVTPAVVAFDERDDSMADEMRTPLFGATFDAPEASRPRLLLVPAIGVLIVGLAIAGVYLWNRPQTASAVSTVAAAPLELVSMRHERQGDSLVVSGLVRNPHNGQPFRGLAAVAFTFDRQGTFLASGRASLDFPQLPVGDESPFSITLPQSAAVARYRVSFRTDGGVVPHVDRRAATAGAVDAAAKN